jgi:hypothetical protein
MNFTRESTSDEKSFVHLAQELLDGATSGIGVKQALRSVAVEAGIRRLQPLQSAFAGFVDGFGELFDLASHL